MFLKILNRIVAKFSLFALQNREIICHKYVTLWGKLKGMKTETKCTTTKEY